MYRLGVAARRAGGPPLRVTSRRSTTDVRRPDVKVVEVGPRDGLQNEANIVPLGIKLGLIEKLSKAGLRNIEAGAFVSPKWVPQMADSSRILKRLMGDLAGPAMDTPKVSYSFLVPNLQGLEHALSSFVPTKTLSSIGPLDEISVFAAATEMFSLKNVNCGISESLQRFIPVFKRAKSLKIRVRAYISVVLGCPYEGPDVSPGRVAELSSQLLSMGADEISLGDTTGMGTAPRTLELLRALDRIGISTSKLAVHFHDTFGQALVNTAVALENGVRVIDGSVAGLGGCPYAKGATGNLATEDLIYFLHASGVTTGVDLDRLVDVGQWISSQLGRDYGSRVGRALLSKR